MTDIIDHGNTPAYAIPLTDKQLIALGRITAIWAQVDLMVDKLLSLVHDLNPVQFRMLVGDKMVGSKLNLLEQSLILIEDGPRHDSIEKFVKLATAVLSERNHATHGVWGWRIQGKKEFIAARHSRTPGKPLRATKLKKLESTVANVSRAAMNAFGIWVGVVQLLPIKLSFGSSESPPERLGREPIPVPSGRPIPKKKPKGKAPRPQSSPA